MSTLGLMICVYLFIIIGLIAVINISNKRTYTEEVFAEIIEYEEYAKDEYDSYYIAVFKYTYNGEEYIVRDKTRKFLSPDKGYKYDIISLKLSAYNPENYIVTSNEYYVPISSRDKAVIVLAIAALLLVFVGRINPFVSIGVFVIAAIVMIVIYIVKSMRRNWVAVEAEIVDTERRSIKGGTVLVHVYKYVYKGEEYKAMSHIGTYEGKGKIGSKIEIYIDDKNPLSIKEDIQFKELPPNSKFNLILIAVGMIVITLLSLFVW